MEDKEQEILKKTEQVKIDTQQKTKKKPVAKTILICLAICTVLVITIVFAIVIIVNNKGERIVQDNLIIGSHIPELPKKKGKINSNKDNVLDLELYKLSQEEYENYKSEVKKDYYIDTNDYSTGYKGYNDDRYAIHIDYIKNKKEVKIRLEAPEDYKDISWPDNELVKQLPIPKSLKGRNPYDKSVIYAVYIGNFSREDFNEYVNQCSNNGFNVDYSKYENSYNAKNSKGNVLRLSYTEGLKEMYISIKEDENSDSYSSKSSNTTSTQFSTNAITSQTNTNTTSTNTTSTNTTSTATQTSSTEKTGLSKEFKDAMDSYEAYMDEYVTFMKKYNSNSSDLSLITQYAEVMKKYTEATKDFEKWGDKDLSKEEEAYYIDVQARVTKKLLEVAG